MQRLGPLLSAAAGYSVRKFKQLLHRLCHEHTAQQRQRNTDIGFNAGGESGTRPLCSLFVGAVAAMSPNGMTRAGRVITSRKPAGGQINQES